MPILIFLTLETIGFWSFVESQGFLVAMSIYWLPTLVGFYLLSYQSRTEFFHLQRDISEGRKPMKSHLDLALKLIGSIFLCLPFLTTRFFALILLFPLTRWLVIQTGEFWLVKKLFKSPMMGFAFQNGPFGSGATFTFGKGFKNSEFGNFRHEFGHGTEDAEKKFRDVSAAKLSTQRRGEFSGDESHEVTPSAKTEIIDVDFIQVEDSKNKKDS